MKTSPRSPRGAVQKAAGKGTKTGNVREDMKELQNKTGNDELDSSFSPESNSFPRFETFFFDVEEVDLRPTCLEKENRRRGQTGSK